MIAYGNLRLVPFIALLVFAGGCTSVRTVDNGTAQSARKVEVGDIVRIVTHSGQQIELEVTDVDKERLTGVRRKKTGRAVTGYEIDPADKDSTEETLRVPFDDVATVQVRGLDGWKTAALVGSTVAVLWLIGLALASLLVAGPLIQ